MASSSVLNTGRFPAGVNSLTKALIIARELYGDENGSLIIDMPRERHLRVYVRGQGRAERGEQMARFWYSLVRRFASSPESIRIKHTCTPDQDVYDIQW